MTKKAKPITYMLPEINDLAQMTVAFVDKEQADKLYANAIKKFDLDTTLSDKDSVTYGIWYNGQSKSYEVVGVRFNADTRTAAVISVENAASTRAGAVNRLKMKLTKEKIV